MKAIPRTLGAPFHAVRRRAALGAAAAAACTAMVLGGFAVSAAQAAEPAAIDDIILLTGADESQRVVNWYASASTAQVVQVAPTNSIKKGQFPANATVFPAVVSANTVNGGYNGHSVITGLSENVKYSYRVGGDGGWSEAHAFKTRKFDGNFDFLFFGDPQIGSSGNVPKDQAGWEDTLEVAVGANPEAELLVSGGDQVETANVESQWTAFLAPEELRSVPWVATIGNHDVGGKAYEQHLWTPNTDRSPKHYRGNPAAQSGGDYWFTYKDVLFIDLNSNAYTASAEPGVDADEAHIGYVSDVIAEHGDEAKYTVLVYHHSIYSPASHANDSDAQERRRDFPTAFSELGVDLVLQGHDHSYSRSYLIRNGEKANPDEQPGADSVFQGPGGVVYVTANSASGSKYYDLTAPRVGSDFGPDPLNPASHWANSVEDQEHVRSYVKVSVRDEHLQVENIRSGTCAAPNAAVELGQESWCGPDEGASPAQPVGSVVDQVVIHRYDETRGPRGGATAPAVTTQQDDVTITTID
ncbi:fibronectin type III domain-containing protein [Agromyces sp. NPDC057865]|uniref:fibronectin type III domain-containing protein n=1 Tax=Agromyces sp. NPDC057865 TaxID=3346267 RepID=UPI00366C35A4